MKYIILLPLVMLSGLLSMFILVFAINDYGVQHLVDVMQSGGEQSQFYISTVVVFIISAIYVALSLVYSNRLLTPKD